jgi:hypothetical protein
MAAMPKRRRMKRALLKRAQAEIGSHATALDYVCHWIAGGRLIKGLAASLQEQLGESVSRSILSTLVHHLGPDASARIAGARRVGATAPVRDALHTAVNPSNRGAGAGKARLWDRRVWLDQAAFRDRSRHVATELTLPQLHLAVVRGHSAAAASRRSAAGIMEEVRSQGAPQTQFATGSPEPPIPPDTS